MPFVVFATTISVATGISTGHPGGQPRQVDTVKLRVDNEEKRVSVSFKLKKKLIVKAVIVVQSAPACLVLQLNNMQSELLYKASFLCLFKRYSLLLMYSYYITING